MFRSITFYGRDSLINSACHHHHSARLSTILYQPTNRVNHRNIQQKTLASPDASMHDFFYLPDGASSHTSGVAQQHLHKDLGSWRFVDKFSWPPSSSNCSPLDYYSFNAVKQEVYSRRATFKDLEEFKKKIKQFWCGCSEIKVPRRAILQFR